MPNPIFIFSDFRSLLPRCDTFCCHYTVFIIPWLFSTELLLSTIVSIPKDVKSSLSSEDNYREIFVFNSIAKMFDYVIIDYLAAVFKLPICNLLIKQNILQHYAPWFILRLYIIMLTMVVTCIVVY